MIKRVMTLLGSYLLTLSALAKTEATAEMQQLQAMAVRKIAGAVLALLGFVWLNVALLLFLMTTSWPIVGALGIGVIGAVIGVVLLKSGHAPEGVLVHTRDVVRGELAAMGVGVSHEPGAPPPDPLLVAPPEHLSPEGAAARLRMIRIEIGQQISPPDSPYLPEGVPPLASRPDFVPKSATMRTVLGLWRTGQSQTGRKVLGGVLSLVALRNPTVRRGMAVAGFVKGVGRVLGTRLRRA